MKRIFSMFILIHLFFAPSLFAQQELSVEANYLPSPACCEHLMTTLKPCCSTSLLIFIKAEKVNHFSAFIYFELTDFEYLIEQPLVGAFTPLYRPPIVKNVLA